MFPENRRFALRVSFMLFLSCFHVCLFTALWSPAAKGLTSWLSLVVSNCEVVTCPLVSWVRCGACLYRFLIFALFSYFDCEEWIFLSCPYRNNGFNFLLNKIPFTLEKREKDFQENLNTSRCYMVLSFKHYNDFTWIDVRPACDRRVAVYFLSFPHAGTCTDM